MINLDLDLLRSFLAVIDAGGFTRAAGRVHRSQSTVSLHVRQLEERIGAALVDRRRRDLQLTAQGEVLLAYAESLVRLHDEAVARLTTHAVHGPLRLGVLEDFASLRLPRLLAAFQRARPEIGVEVSCAISHALRRALAEEEIDFAVLRRDPGVGDAGRLLFREPLVWAERAGGTRHRAEPLPLVMFAPGCPYRPHVLRALETAGRAWRIVYTGASLAGVQAAVAAGFGVGVLARSTLTPELRRIGSAAGLPRLPATEVALYRGNAGDEALGNVIETLLKDGFRTAAVE